MTFRAFAAIPALLATLTLAALTGCTPAPGPSGYQSCDNGGPVDQAVLNNFQGTDIPHAFYIVHRESGCDPCAYYPGHSGCTTWNPSTAKGLFQLFGHDDLIHGACPFLYPLPWQVPDCNARAARFLYNDAGWGPWGG